MEWTGSEWLRNDVPDFAFQSTAADGTNTPTPPNNKAFFMRWEQNACLLSTGMNDMPLPEHYEPFESPVKNQMNGSQTSPMIQFADDPSVKPGTAEEYPIVATTYSITEHWQTGQQSHSCPSLNESQPGQFIEISNELAAEKGIKNGDTVRVWNNRGDITMTAMVTHRLVPLTVDGRTIHEVGMIHHWGWAHSFEQGPLTNDLTPNVGDPNSFIPEYKAFLVNIEKA